MKAGSNLLNAVSAIALSAGIVMTGAGVMSLAAVTVAEAAVISRVDVRGNSRVDASTVSGNLTITPAHRSTTTTSMNRSSGCSQQAFSPMFASACPVRP
jgi:outer membrane protein assembly factor BamA